MSDISIGVVVDAVVVATVELEVVVHNYWQQWFGLACYLWW